jgi:hypothetical protein
MVKEKKVTVFSIGKKPSGHGHYKITIEYKINDGKNEIGDLYKNLKTASFVTTDMQSIDEWNEGGAETCAARFFFSHCEDIEIDSDEEIFFDF